MRDVGLDLRTHLINPGADLVFDDIYSIDVLTRISLCRLYAMKDTRLRP